MGNPVAGTEDDDDDDDDDDDVDDDCHPIGYLN